LQTLWPEAKKKEANLNALKKTRASPTATSEYCFIFVITSSKNFFRRYDGKKRLQLFSSNQPIVVGHLSG